ncbi:Hypothetical_protein [Hexamita inflata]|uniref:Hypothetical_protein n=1 Tax=Hexamita inflata TaxID=28002 RepID=A0AA86RM25_9EUKA|nr:Hypothetical protein HINF_LOCUS21110 [Hexamita inflata]CAI9968945.1 Hypothetical protein HINF_LOCUS56590 [Hexamita inflata]
MIGTVHQFTMSACKLLNLEYQKGIENTIIQCLSESNVALASKIWFDLSYQMKKSVPVLKNYFEKVYVRYFRQYESKEDSQDTAQYINVIKISDVSAFPDLNVSFNPFGPYTKAIGQDEQKMIEKITEDNLKADYLILQKEICRNLHWRKQVMRVFRQLERIHAAKNQSLICMSISE